MSSEELNLEIRIRMKNRDMSWSSIVIMSTVSSSSELVWVSQKKVKGNAEERSWKVTSWSCRRHRRHRVESSKWARRERKEMQREVGSVGKFWVISSSVYVAPSGKIALVWSLGIIEVVHACVLCLVEPYENAIEGISIWWKYARWGSKRRVWRAERREITTRRKGRRHRKTVGYQKEEDGLSKPECCGRWRLTFSFGSNHHLVHLEPCLEAPI